MLVGEVHSSADLLTRISQEPNPSRTQLLRVFRKYVSPDTSVEMLKRKNKIPEIIAEFGTRFRSLEKVRRNLLSRPDPDEAMMAVLSDIPIAVSGSALLERIEPLRLKSKNSSSVMTAVTFSKVSICTK